MAKILFSICSSFFVHFWFCNTHYEHHSKSNSFFLGLTTFYLRKSFTFLSLMVEVVGGVFQAETWQWKQHCRRTLASDHRRIYRRRLFCLTRFATTVIMIVVRTWYRNNRVVAFQVALGRRATCFGPRSLGNSPHRRTLSATLPERSPQNPTALFLDADKNDRGFELQAPFEPTGDQPAAIETLVNHFRNNKHMHDTNKIL